VLEIGCGVGGLQLELLRSGARSALGMDVSAGMITQAERLAQAAGLSGKVTYRTADFMETAEGVPGADVVVLDKVLCCSPDALGLIRKSAAKARKLYAVSFPRDGFLAKAAFTVPWYLGRLLRWSFYPFYHEPLILERAIVAAGWQPVVRSTTPVWQIVVFSPANGAGSLRDPLSENSPQHLPYRS